VIRYTYSQGVLADVDLLQRITEACRSCVREFVRDRTGIDGRIGTNALTPLLKWTGFYVDPWVRGVENTEFSTANRNELINTFK
jgi:magnesium chelatase subunit H